MTNIHACLVHEEPDCVADLVANLRHFDPESVVLLYDGSEGQRLTRSGALAEEDGVRVHPAPRPMTWGRLHGFAFDCLGFALDLPDFTSMTVVDSDQLLVRHGYAGTLADHLVRHRDTGCLVSADGGTQPRDTRSALARMAWREFDLWRPFLRRFAAGERHWPTWTFWPGTVFTREAAADLVELARDPQLMALLTRTRLWATEEVVLPTLVALRGHRVTPTPLRDDLVRFRVSWSVDHISAAAQHPELFWVHPVPRRSDDPVRTWLRSHADGYTSSASAAVSPGMTVNGASPGTTVNGVAPVAAVNGAALLEAEDAPADRVVPPPLLEPTRVLRAMETVEGWFSWAEGELLMGSALHALTTLPAPHVIVEVGSYCGRSTLVLGSVARAVDPSARVVAIDPHEGTVGSADTRIDTGSPTFERFTATIRRARLEEVVHPVRACSFEVDWDEPVAMLFIDGLHDFASVAADYSHFEAHLRPGTIVAFHDYTPGYQGVVRLVDYLISARALEWVGHVDSLAITRFIEAVGVASLQPVLDEMDAIDGWLARDEAAYLGLLTAECVSLAPEASVVEVGSYCGRGTVVLARASAATRRGPVHAVDTFDGVVGSATAGLFHGEPTWDRFHSMIDRSDLRRLVQPHQGRSGDVDWQGPVSLLVVDGWHDYASVRADVDRFAPSIVVGGMVAFHDHADYAPDVSRVFDELVGTGSWQRVGQVGTLAALRRGRDPAPAHVHATARTELVETSPAPPSAVLVSCLMPTRDRPALVRFALETFARQDHPDRELIVVDDGVQPIEDLVAHDPRVVYLRPGRRLTIGAKRNLAAEASCGQYLAHWDDDDWYSPDRLSTQLAALTLGGRSVVGSNSFLYWEPATQRAWRYTYPRPDGGSWAHDATLLLARCALAERPYPDLNHGVDVRWLATLHEGALMVDNSPIYVGLMHSGNTSRKNTSIKCWTRVPVEQLDALVGTARDAWLAAVGLVNGR